MCYGFCLWGMNLGFDDLTSDWKNISHKETVLFLGKHAVAKSTPVTEGKMSQNFKGKQHSLYMYSLTDVYVIWIMHSWWIS